MDDALRALPDHVRARLEELRAEIYQAAEDTGTAPLEASLKWGQPSFASKVGTPLRLSWSPKMGEVCGAYVHCQTTLVDSYRTLFPDAFAYQDNRAVLVPLSGEFDRMAFRKIASMALTYHRDKG